MRSTCLIAILERSSISMCRAPFFHNNSIENISRLITAPEGEMFDNDPTHIAPEGALYSTYANIGKSRNTGMSLYLNWNASPKTRLYVNGRGNYSDLKSEAQGLHNYGWNGSFYGGVQHTLPLKIRLSLNGGGSTPYINYREKVPAIIIIVWVRAVLS